MKINLGCGDKILKGYINVDLNNPNADIKWDLNKIPYPFNNNSADKILLHHILEHLSINKYEVIIELRRILKNEGILEIILPIDSNIIQHQSYRHTKNYFRSLYKKQIFIKEDGRSSYYNPIEWDLISFNRIGLRNPFVWFYRLLLKIEHFFDSLFFDSYRYILKKKRD